ncbi:MAG: hypothetical protein HFI01_16830 [Lachnospiraceae bacterium]|nr:hypothetical protein [Lachnospiraceae bacterium]MCI9344595.1 hypothetical protein [Lachnospiraceae bacterium]
MNTDSTNVLYQKIGVTIEKLALDLLSKNVGDRIQPISQYQEDFAVSRGTIQNAIRYLEEAGAVNLTHHGHQGTYIAGLDYGKLQENCLRKGLMGIMPLPYSATYEGFATAIYEQLKDLRFNMAYARGAAGRIDLVVSGAYQFAVSSQYAAEYAIDSGKEIEVVLNFGTGSFLSQHVLLLRDVTMDGIVDGMRVAYDSDSLDQSKITQNLVKGKKVELVGIRTQQTIAALRAGIIDAGVWNYDDILENHHLEELKVVFLDASEYNKLFSTAVLLVRKDGGYLKEVLKKYINVKQTMEILEDVRNGRRTPSY